MSPTEDQLRRALREGEGDGPDPDTVILRAAAYRDERRTRIRSAVAVAAVVAGIGTGVGFLSTSGVLNDEQHHPLKAAGSAGANFSAEGADKDKAAGGGTGGVANVPSAYAGQAASVPASACPTRLPAASVTSDATTPMFSGDVNSVTVCGYQGTGSVVRAAGTDQPLSRTYTDGDASAIAHSAESALPKPTGMSCKAMPATGVHALLLLGTYTSGGKAKPVVVGLGCDSAVMNGTTTRYSWPWPSQLTQFLDVLQAAAR